MDENMDSIEDALLAIRSGSFALVVDDFDRENEGDFIGAACHATKESVIQMLKHTSGVLCVPVTPARADELALPLMVPENEDPYRTAFTVTVDYRHGTSTGISAADRAATIRAMSDHKAAPADFTRPGHIFPLLYRPGGVLVRGGHTEASVDLVRMAGCGDVAYLSEVYDHDSGEMTRLDGLIALAQQLRFPSEGGQAGPSATAAPAGQQAQHSGTNSSGGSSTNSSSGRYGRLAGRRMPLISIADIQRWRYRREVLVTQPVLVRGQSAASGHTALATAEPAATAPSDSPPATVAPSFTSSAVSSFVTAAQAAGVPTQAILHYSCKSRYGPNSYEYVMVLPRGAAAGSGSTGAGAGGAAPTAVQRPQPPVSSVGPALAPARLLTWSEAAEVTYGGCGCCNGSDAAGATLATGAGASGSHSCCNASGGCCWSAGSRCCKGIGNGSSTGANALSSCACTRVQPLGSTYGTAAGRAAAVSGGYSGAAAVGFQGDSGTQTDGHGASAPGPVPVIFLAIYGPPWENVQGKEASQLATLAPDHVASKQGSATATVAEGVHVSSVSGSERPSASAASASATGTSTTHIRDSSLTAGASSKAVRCIACVHDPRAAHVSPGHCVCSLRPVRAPGEGVPQSAYSQLYSPGQSVVTSTGAGTAAAGAGTGSGAGSIPAQLQAATTAVGVPSHAICDRVGAETAQIFSAVLRSVQASGSAAGGGNALSAGGTAQTVTVNPTPRAMYPGQAFEAPGDGWTEQDLASAATAGQGTSAAVGQSQAGQPKGQGQATSSVGQAVDEAEGPSEASLAAAWAHTWPPVQLQYIPGSCQPLLKVWEYGLSLSGTCAV